MTSVERAAQFYYFWTGSTWTPGIGETPTEWMTRVQEHRRYIIARLAISFDAHAAEAVAAEREACAELVWTITRSHLGSSRIELGLDIAAAIQTRETSPAKPTPKPIGCVDCGRPVPAEELARADPWKPIWAYWWRCPDCTRLRATSPADADTPPSPP